MKLLFDQNISFRLVDKITAIFPPKIIWIRTGNLNTNNIELLLKSKSKLILEFLEGNFACLEIKNL